MTLRRTRRGSVRVHPSNYTPELIDSDANCHKRGVPDIGFAVSVDAVQSELLEQNPGIDCVVCLAGGIAP